MKNQQIILIIISALISIAMILLILGLSDFIAFFCLILVGLGLLLILVSIMLCVYLIIKGFKNIIKTEG